jgi:hypothetical protein
MEFRNSQAGSNARRYPEPTRQQTTTNDNANTQGGGAEAPVRNTMQMQHNNSGSKMGKPMMAIVAVVVVLVLLLGGWFAWSKLAGDAGVKGGQYQAVFLTNGQVYFGKVSDINNGYVKLSDIYYLQVQQSVQPDDKSKTSATSNDQSQVSLAKLGSELHGPEDTMYISRQQVLFWENLKNDGKVVQAINSYKQNNK